HFLRARVERNPVGRERGFGHPRRHRAAFGGGIDDEALDAAALEQRTDGGEVHLAIVMVDVERGVGALELRAYVPGLRPGEHGLALEVGPALDLVLVARVDGGADLDAEGPEALHRLALHLVLEALEAMAVVGELPEGDVGAVVAFELTLGIALDRDDRP